MKWLTHDQVMELGAHAAGLLRDGWSHDEMAAEICHMAGRDVIDVGVVIYEAAYIVPPRRRLERAA